MQKRKTITLKSSIKSYLRVTNKNISIFPLLNPLPLSITNLILLNNTCDEVLRMFSVQQIIPQWQRILAFLLKTS